MSIYSTPPSGDRGRLGGYYVPLGDIRRMGIPALAGAVATIATHSLPLAAGATAAAAALTMVKKLTEPELEVFYTLGQLTATNVYSVWVSTEELLSALPSDRSPAEYRRVLAGMSQKGMLTEATEMWRAVW